MRYDEKKTQKELLVLRTEVEEKEEENITIIDILLCLLAPYHPSSPLSHLRFFFAIHTKGVFSLPFWPTWEFGQMTIPGPWSDPTLVESYNWKDSGGAESIG